MNWFDLTVLIFLLIAAVNGYRKGFVAMLGGLATILLAAIFGGKLATVVLLYLNAWMELSFNVASVIAYVVAFLLIAVTVGLLVKFIQSILQAVSINFLNRLAGILLALGTTMLLLSILLNLVLMLDINEKIIKPAIKQQSIFYERVQVVVPSVVPYLNQETWEKYVPQKYRDEIEKSTPYERVDSGYRQKYLETVFI